MSIDFTHNLDVKGKELKKFASASKGKYGREIMQGAMEIIGNVSVSEFMNQGGGAVRQKELTVRTGRLQSSLVGAYRFNKSILPSLFEPSGGGSGSNEAIREVSIKGSSIVGLLGSKTPWARIHEVGGDASKPMPKRPYLSPALVAATARIMKFISATYDKVWGKAKI